MQLLEKLTFAFLSVITIQSVTAQESELTVDKTNVVAIARFLETDPFNEIAPLARGLPLKWEEKSTDVVDVVCPSMFGSLLNGKEPFASELFAQFIIGSAAYQIQYPAEKGKLVPQQLAGVRSMLKAYHSYQAKKPGIKVPELDGFAAQDSAGTLPAYMESLAASECKR